MLISIYTNYLFLLITAYREESNYAKEHSSLSSKHSQINNDSF